MASSANIGENRKRQQQTSISKKASKAMKKITPAASEKSAA